MVFSFRSPAIAACATGLAILAAGAPARAQVVGATPDASFATTPDTVTFGGSSYTFSAIAGASPAAVATTGSGEVTSFGGGVSDFESGSTIDQTGELYGFSAFPTASAIPNSAADDFIGLEFTLSDGVHYGYAEVSGTELVSYGYASTAGASILTGAAATAVPEPAAFALFGSGVLAVVWARRRRGGSGGLPAV